MITKERPETLHGSTRRIKTGCGNLYVTINEDSEGNTIEVFCKLGKTGGCGASQMEAMGRLISVSLRSGYDIDGIIKQLKGISCHQPMGLGPMKVSSCSDGVAQLLMAHKARKEVGNEKKDHQVADQSVPPGIPSKK